MKTSAYFAFLVSLLLASCTSTPTPITEIKTSDEVIASFIAPLQKADNQAFTYHFDYEFYKERPNRTPKVRTGSFTLAYLNRNQFSLRFAYKNFTARLSQDNGKLFVYIPYSKTKFLDINPGYLPENHFTLQNLISTSVRMEPGLKNIYNFLSGINASNLRNSLKNRGLEITPSKENPSIVQITKNKSPVMNFRIEQNQINEITWFNGKSKIILKTSLTHSAELARAPEFPETLIKVKNHELNRSLTRGLARLIEVKYRENIKADQEDFVRQGFYGSYRMKDGQRIVKLKGTPYQIGWQHGNFLPQETRRVIDSTLYLVGLAYSIKKSQWFFDEIRKAQIRLDKFTPPDFLEEMRGVAKGANVAYSDVHMANYFPALFHCSGFTLKDDVTVDGKLYHGRILDYMCGVGLQYNAAVFAVEKEGKIPFINVSFGGFIGSVTGMNQQQISLGEMGGKGVGDWDGVSMPILMRMALENAQTLSQTKAIFKNNPRTCEYYYVFADGKTKDSVAVYATPNEIHFVDPGEKHPQLRHSVPKCLLISGGKRYEALVSKTKAKLGTFDEQGAIELMGPGVAGTNSNLHSVLFIPEELRFWVSNAGKNGAAYTQKFHHYDLNLLLKESFYQRAATDK